MLATLRILAVTFAALTLPLAAHAASRDLGAMEAQRIHPKHHARPAARPAARAPAVSDPAIPPPRQDIPEEENAPADQDSKPDDDKEVSPGESPASCDGCELAGWSMAGSLWGLFGLRRKRRPLPVIRGLQPR